MTPSLHHSIKLLLALLLATTTALSQTKSVTKTISNNGLVENLVVPSGKTLTIASGGSIIAASGSTVTGFGSGGGGGLDNIASSITGATLTLSGTLTTGRTLTVRDLAGTLALTSDLSSYLTTATAASTYEPIIAAGTTGQYWRGDKSWQTLNAAAVGLGSVANALQLVAANNLSDLANAATARSNLGLGTLATQNGTITDYLTTASATSTYQPLSATLTTLSSATAAGLALMDDADAAAQRSTLGLGTLATQNGTISDYLTTATAASTYQPLDAELTALAGLTSAADRLPYFTGAGTAAVTTLTSQARSLLDDTTAATMRGTLGLGTIATQSSANVTIGGGVVTGLSVFSTIGAASFGDGVTAGQLSIFDTSGSYINIITVPAFTSSPRELILPDASGTFVTTGNLSSITATGTITSGTWQGSIIAPAYLGTGTSITTKFLRGDGTWQTIAGGGDALTSNPLSQFAATTSAQFAGVISDETGTGAVVLASSPTLTTPDLGTPSAVTLTNATGLPVSTGISGLGTGVATMLATPSSANLASAVTDETGSGALVFGTSPTLTTPNLGTPSSITLTNATGLPLSTGITGTLPIANGGTGQTSQTAAFDALAPTTTKGDLIVHNGSDNIRVAVGGTNGHVLTVDSAEASGVKWAAASGGGGGKIAQVVYTEDATQKSTTSTIPIDDTIPQNTEGTAYTELDTTITPTNASSTLLIEFQTHIFSTAAGVTPTALFKDSEADAIATGYVTCLAAYAHQLTIRVRVNAGSTSAQTFKIRFGRSGTATVYLNDYTSAYFGGTAKSTMTITEILP